MSRRWKGGRSTWVVAVYAARLLVYVALLLLFSQVAVLSAQPGRGCSPADFKAMAAFAAAMDSGVTIPSWEVNINSGNTNTSSSVVCCGWRGVQCDASSGRVVGINLTNMGLKGFIPDSISGMDQLTVLNLSNNSLRGSIPNGLLLLPRLQTLDLSQNNLSGTIQLGSTPQFIRTFNISFNRLGGTLPVPVGSPELEQFDARWNLFTGPINATAICAESPQIRTLSLSANSLGGEFPYGFGGCRELKELMLDANGISGKLPDDLFRLESLERLFLQENQLNGTIPSRISNLTALIMLDLSSNAFSGTIPDVFTGLTRLTYLSAATNNLSGNLPPSLSSLSAIEVLNFRNNSLGGAITPNINFSNMPNLNSLDLGSNNFTGAIPGELSSCTQLQTLNLARNRLSGKIPDGFANMSSLSFLSLSNNSLSNISQALTTLQHCPNLTALVLTINFHGDRMPDGDGIQGFRRLKLLVVANCGLYGSVPSWLAQCSKLQLLDLSWNRLEGGIPPWIGANLTNLFYLDLSNNSLSGQLPVSLTNLSALTFGNSSSRTAPPTVFPFFSKQNNRARGLQYNQLNSFPPTIDLSTNTLSGPIPSQIGLLTRLHVLDLSVNNFSGTIPGELSEITSLECLNLSNNALTGNIPPSLMKLTFLSKFSVANNLLYGPIPNGVQLLTFPNSSYLGNRHLCGSPLKSCDFAPAAAPGAIVGNLKKKKKAGVVIGVALAILIAAILLLALVYYLLMSRTRSRRVEDTSINSTNKKGGALRDSSLGDDDDDMSAESSLVLLFQSKDIGGTKARDLSVDDILRCTNNFDQANIIGCGGFGLVFKATLPDGRKVAIKRLSGECGQMEREFQAEVQALSRAQHANLVLLQGYCRAGGDRLLIYSYMENGSLDYWLHEREGGGSVLTWDIRLRVARGAAKGLAYLHQSCHPHILHRDVKSSNILLDERFEAHLADFGLARLMSPYETHVTTDLVGTLGYIPPEYGQAPVATFKGDVYSFGVVLLELLTGRRPMDICKPRECRDLTSWVLQMRAEKRELEIFDRVVYDEKWDKQLLQVLDVACCCLSESPKVRPRMEDIVSWLDGVALASSEQPALR